MDSWTFTAAALRHGMIVMTGGPVGILYVSMKSVIGQPSRL
ncbi:hypothetical protein ABRQ22_14715 [Cellulosimicrobium sp. ES-005]|uniref:Uncharacterized protein n=1 Tax=Cellulosimicrobium sp. ES-005 TaxID=3163031 RepID=A0AAU8FW24_9MICO